MQRSEWGDVAAGPIYLRDTAEIDPNDGLVVYRNILRDFGPRGAVKYIKLLPESIRREASYYTLVHMALKGVHLTSSHLCIPELPKDNFRQAVELYRQANTLSEHAVGGRSAEEELSAQLAVSHLESLIETTTISSSNTREIKSLMDDIRALNDPEVECQLLEKLVGKLIDS
jgi:hypothetical protein